MKRFNLQIIMLLLAVVAGAAVKPGIEVLPDYGRK